MGLAAGVDPRKPSYLYRGQYHGINTFVFNVRIFCISIANSCFFSHPCVEFLVQLPVLRLNIDFFLQ